MAFSFFFCQTGAMKWLMGKSLLHLTTNLKRSHTFFRENGGPNFALINNRFSHWYINAVWKWALTDESERSALPIHPSFLCLWDGAPPTPLGSRTLVSGPSKGGPLSFDPLYGCRKTSFCPTLCPGYQSFCRRSMLIALPNLEDLFTVMAPSGTPSTPSFLWPPYLPSGCPME